MPDFTNPEKQRTPPRWAVLAMLICVLVTLSVLAGNGCSVPTTAQEQAIPTATPERPQGKPLTYVAVGGRRNDRE